MVSIITGATRDRMTAVFPDGFLQKEAVFLESKRLNDKEGELNRSNISNRSLRNPVFTNRIPDTFLQSHICQCSKEAVRFKQIKTIVLVIVKMPILRISPPL